MKPEERVFLLLESEALNSIASIPHSFATSRTVVVLPTPGGPESRAALKVELPPVGSSNPFPVHFGLGL